MVRSNRGFTIVELLIATTAFSVVLLLSLTAFLQIGRIFYKGITITNTQQRTRRIYDDMTASFHAGGTVAPVGSASNSRKYFCVSGTRYTYILGNKVDLSNEDTTSHFGLIKDQLPGNGCASPDQTPILPAHDEMLGNNMRLSNFSVSSISTTLYQINITVAYGDDTVLNNPKTTAPDCQNSLSRTQFCDVAKLQTVVNVGS